MNYLNYKTMKIIYGLIKDDFKNTVFDILIMFILSLFVVLLGVMLVASFILQINYYGYKI